MAESKQHGICVCVLICCAQRACKDFVVNLAIPSIFQYSLSCVWSSSVGACARGSLLGQMQAPCERKLPCLDLSVGVESFYCPGLLAQAGMLEAALAPTSSCFRVTWETYLSRSEGINRERFTQEGKTHCICGWCHPLGWEPRLNKRRQPKEC